jgi:hypothetical protein
MRHIKSYKSFESISISSEIINNDKFKSKFDETKFSGDFIDDIKEYLYDFSDDHLVQIQFIKTSPRFKDRNRPSLIEDCLSIEIKSGDWYSEEIPRSQANPRTPINNEEFFNILKTLESYCKDYNFEVVASESYLPFESIEEFISTYKDRPLYNSLVVIF